MNTNDDIKFAFTPVGAKLSEKQKMCILKMQNLAIEFGQEIVDLVPSSADRTHALRLLLDVKFWCIQAITHEKEQKNATPQKEDIRIKALEDKVSALQTEIGKALEAAEQVLQSQVEKTEVQSSTVNPNRQ